MKKLMFAVAAAIALAGPAMAEPVKDTKDLEAVHMQIQQAIQELDRARKANNYDMSNHGIRAEEALKTAEKELSEAIAAAKAAK